jgi:hypothetical protein
MQRSNNDIWVGLLVLIGAAALLFLALQSANLLSLSFQKTYQVTALFDNIGGLKKQAAVKSAGVVVGLHPGTVDSALSQPFQNGLPGGQLTAPDTAAANLLGVLARLGPEQSGRVFDFTGAEVPA